MAEGLQFKRGYPRRKVSLPCQVSWPDHEVHGKILDISYEGVGILIPQAIESTEKRARIEIPEGIWLKVRPVYVQERGTDHRVGCKVELIEGGKKQWARLCDLPRW